MIQDSEPDVKTRSIGDFDSADFGIEQENLGMAYEAFMQYSDPIGSIVREITSNAWDATIEAGNDDPVVVSASRRHPPDDERWIAFKDNGTGLVPLPKHTPDGRTLAEMRAKGDISQEVYQNKIQTIREKILDAGVPSMLVYKMFFSSTKRDIIDQIGYFGLGAKSPLGYTDMFEVITRRAGWKYHYVVRKGEEKPQLDLLDYEKTEKRNGTTVRVPIASKRDWDSFVDSIHTQLAYFDNVVFDGRLDGEVDNDFKIYRGDHIIYRPDAEFDTMHLCLGKVYYPLDFDVMGIREGYYRSYKDERSGYHVPVGLYFPLEDQKELPLKVVWNRESIEYNDKTKESIREKLKLAKEELQELWDEQYNEIDTVEEWYEALRQAKQDHIVVNEDVKIPITDTLIDDRKISIPNYDKFFDKTPGDPFYLLKFHRAVEDGYINQDRDDIDIANAFQNPENYDQIFVTEEEFSTKKNKWISENILAGSKKNFTILKLRNPPSDLNDPDIKEKVKNRFKRRFRTNADYSKEPTDLQLKAMLQFEEKARRVFKKAFSDYDEVTVSDSFKPKSKKKNQNRYATYDPDKKFPLKTASLKDGYNDEYGWARQRWKYDDMKTLDRRGTMVIYGHRDDDERLKKVMELLDRIGKFDSRGYKFNFDKKKLRVVKIAKSRADMFSELRGSYHVDNFWESDHPIFYRVINAFAIDDSLPSKKSVRKWKEYLPEASKLYSELYELKGSYSFNYGGNVPSSTHWMDDLLEEKYHLIDPEIIKKLETVQGYIMKYPLLTWLERGTPNLRGLSKELDLDQELEEYIEDRSPIHPHLLYRYKSHKNQQENNG